MVYVSQFSVASPYHLCRHRVRLIARSLSKSNLKLQRVELCRLIGFIWHKLLFFAGVLLNSSSRLDL